MGASQSTSSSTTTNHDEGRKYDVFISFRGEDTGDNFTSHLYDALCRKNIHTFKGHRLGLGDEISPALLDAIENSRISIVIFSKQFASSKRCLRELVEIMKGKKTKKQFVIPVFYQVDPSDVRKQTGSFKDAFRKHRKESQEELQKWRDALTEASNLAGWHSYVTRPESRLVVEIVKDVLNKLKDVSPSNDYGSLVGLRSRTEKIKSLLSIEILDVRIVGIWGMGGIGKTTIAGAIFDEISCQFEGRCFVANVREESKKFGLFRLRDQILSTILEEEVNFGTPNIPLFIKRRLQSKKIIVVLDDVNSFLQLEVLAGGLNKLGLGSRIIVTSRDKQVLRNSGVVEDNIYEVEALDNCEALQLFCKYAFREDQLSSLSNDLMAFAHVVVDYANGNPLALKVLGSSLYRKSRQEWESALHKLKKIPNVEIHNILKISYDGLDKELKEIFLDIACFFRGKSRDNVMKILNTCYIAAKAGLHALIDLALVTISYDKIEMHDLLQEMGREIAHQESINPGERSRLHNHEDVYLVLKRNIGSEAVKGIFLDISKIKNVNMSSEAFEKMCNVRFLKFYNSDTYIEDPTSISKVQLPSGLSCLPDRLSYFNWDGFPLNVLPSNVNLENLVELHLFDSNVDRLWEGKKHAPNLKWFILGNSKHLTNMPDLSGSPHLEVIDLTNCRRLPEISYSIQHLPTLKQLRLTGCEGLRSFSRSIHFESRVNVNLNLCTKLTKFPQISGDIDILTLSETGIEEIPSSIECLTKLRMLDLSNCARLEHISTSLYKLKSLTVLNLSYCNLTEIPKDIGCLSMLEDLSLCGLSFESLPKSIKQLSKLSSLSLDDCNMLQSLMDLPLGLRYLHAENCKQLQSLPDASYFAERVTKCYTDKAPFLQFTLTNSLKFNLKVFGNVLAESVLLITEHLEFTKKEYQDEKNTDNHAIRIFCPGSEIPEWFGHQNSGCFIDIQLPQHDWCNKKLVGLFFCAVISSNIHLHSKYDPHMIPFDCDFKTDYGDKAHCRGCLEINNPIIDSDHIFIGYIDCSHFKLRRDHYTTGSFAFWPAVNCRVKSCGVSLIYVRANESQFGETMVEEHTETRKFLDEADTGGSGSDICDDEEMDSHPKRFHEFKSTFSNNKVVIFYRTMRDRASLLCCYCWIFLLCLFCGLCVFGMLGLLLLHLSTLCEIYLSSHMQIMQGRRR